MGNQPNGWFAPPYVTAQACQTTGTIGGGATLWGANSFCYDPTVIVGGDRYAIYHFPNRVATLHGFMWGTCELVGIGMMPFSMMRLGVELVTVPFTMADGDPTPPSAGFFNNLGFINPPNGFPPPGWDNLCPPGQSPGGVPPGPYYGVRVRGLLGGTLIVAPAGIYPLRWPCVVVGVEG